MRQVCSQYDVLFNDRDGKNKIRHSATIVQATQAHLQIQSSPLLMANLGKLCADLTPANIMVKLQSKIRCIDFGLDWCVPIRDDPQRPRILCTGKFTKLQLPTLFGGVSPRAPDISA